LAAFDAATGALVTTFVPNLNGIVRGLSVSPDGTRLYVVGSFTQANGVTRNRVAAYSLPGGALVTTFAPSANAAVWAVQATNTTVYVGGDFGQIAGASRLRVAALNASNGANVASFNAPVPDGRVQTLALAPDVSRVLIGGSFTNVNAAANTGEVASLHPTTGAVMPWAIGGTAPHTDNCIWTATKIVTFGTVAYVAGEGTQPGCLDGTYAANIADGSQVWISWCLGATQTIAVLNGWLYKGAHTHDCAYDEGGNMGGFVGPQNPDDFFWWRLTTQRITDGSWAHWSPNTNGSGPAPVGPRVLASDGTRLFVGGDFTTVNGAGQQGVTRFEPGNSAPLNPTAPSVTATAAGTLTVIAPTVEDRDSGTLTYSIFRDGGTTPVATRTAVSYPWTRPTIRFDDTGLSPGSTHTYTVRVSDTQLSSAMSPASASVQVRTAEPPDYPAEVLNATPASYWRLGDAGSALADSSPNGATGITVDGVTDAATGAVEDGGAKTLNGSTGYLASTAAAAPPAQFTQSAWFKTTSLRGGAILGVSNEQTGAGTYNDRAVWMENDGALVFGARQSATGNRFSYVRSPNSYNDGRWHQVVATYNGTALALYVDGSLAATLTAVHVATTPAFLRAGYLHLGNYDVVFGRNGTGRTAPNSFFFAGDIDEVATYGSALSAAQVRNQFISSVPGNGPGEPPPPPPPPGDSYPELVDEDNPWLYWRLGDPAGSPTTDASGNGRTGTYRAGLTYGSTGALSGDVDTAVTNPGTSGIAYTNAVTAGPSTYSLETWVRTTTTRGGKLIGLENVQTGWGTSYDRQLYMTNAGVISYGIVTGGVRQTVSTPATYNNGAWHHVVATQDATGMKLYVDGVLRASAAFATPDAYNGYWRVGGGNVTSWPGAPTSPALAGTQDETAVYLTALTPARIAAHYAAGNGA
jgi:hypothetical protein